jgi:hypothetical protein
MLRVVGAWGYMVMLTRVLPQKCVSGIEDC